ncbi:hypothetical protein FF1_044952 [Malus domestica]
MECTVEESVLDIHLVKRPAANSSNGQETADSNELSNGGERLFVINTFALREPFGDKASLVAFDGTVGMILDFEDPFTSNGALVEG